MTRRRFPYIDEADDLANATLLREEIRSELDTMSEREESILSAMLGFRGRTYTVDELANEFGVSNYRVREIYDKAIRKLRHRSRSAGLEGYKDIVTSLSAALEALSDVAVGHAY